MIRYKHGFAAGSIVAGLTLFTSAVPSAKAQRSTGENSFLGIRLYGKFSDVLRRFGQPSEIQVGDPFISEVATEGTGATGTAGGSNNGLPGFPNRGGGPPGGGGGYGPYSGPPSGGGSRGGYSPSGGGGGGYGPYSGPPGGGGPPAGYGPPGGLGGRPGGPAGGGAGGTGSSQGAQPNAQGEYEESTWWYHIKKKDTKGRLLSTVHYAFIFNKEGRVIQISLYGYSSPFRTRKGVGLSSQLGDVLQNYGSGVDGERTGDNLVMRFDVPKDGVKSKYAFQMSKNRVVGITLAVVNPQAAPPIQPNGVGAGPGGYGPPRGGGNAGD